MVDAISQEKLNICIAKLTVPLATEKSSPTGNTFELKFVLLFDSLIPIFIENQNIYIAFMSVTVSAKKSKHTDTPIPKHELKFVCFFILLIYY